MHTDSSLESECIHITSSQILQTFDSGSKVVSKDLSMLVNACESIKGSSNCFPNDDGEIVVPIGKKEALDHLDQFVGQLDVIESRVKSVDVITKDLLHVLERRVNYLIEDSSDEAKKRIKEEVLIPNHLHNNLHLERLIIDFLLREGCFRTIESYLSSTAEISGLSFGPPAIRRDNLCIPVFKEYFHYRRLILDRDFSQLFEWCEKFENELRRFNNNRFEFLLKTSQFLNLIRIFRLNEYEPTRDGDDIYDFHVSFKLDQIDDRTGEIKRMRRKKMKKRRRTIDDNEITHSILVAFARKYLRPFYNFFPDEIEASLAHLSLPLEEIEFHNRQLCSRDKLLTEFHRNFFRVNRIQPASLLEIYVHSGIIAMQLPGNVETDVSKKDSNPHFPPNPFFDESVGKMSKGLPSFSKMPDHSLLRCRASGDVINEENPPLVFPNGSVIGRREARKRIRRNGGFLKDPRNKEMFSYRQLQRGYVVN